MDELRAVILGGCARHGRLLLVAGLLIGLTFPALADGMRASIQWSIAALLLVAAIRIGPDGMRGRTSRLGLHVGLTALMQILLPLAVLLLAWLVGWHGTLLLCAVLVVSAPPISGGPNLVLMLGGDGASALRQLVTGTALLPFTVLLVLPFLPQFDDAGHVLVAAVKLLLVIALASAIGFAIRIRYLPRLSSRALSELDGLSALLMSIVVIGLMSAVGPALREEPARVGYYLLFAFVLNIGLQSLGRLLWQRWPGGEYTLALSVLTGNRNIALFLTALPAALIDELILFIGCYQFPMYLTPLLMRRFYARLSSHGASSSK